MKPHAKKMIGPIVVTVLLIGYYLLYFGLLTSLVGGVWRVILCVAPLVFSFVTLKVCIERIREIRKGEEDDISQY